MPKNLLIFDLDGTLIDSVPDLATAVNTALAQHDLPQRSVAQIRSFVGNGAYSLCQRSVPAGTSDDQVRAVHQSFLTAYTARTCVDSVAYDGVSDGLARLHAHGYTLAIATNKPYQFVPSILQHFGWQDFFAKVLGGDSLPVKKPDPAPLLHICQSLGIDPNNAFMIGDSKNDILAGKNAQIDTLALSYGYNYDEPISHSKPTHCFDKFGDLVEFCLAIT